MVYTTTVDHFKLNFQDSEDLFSTPIFFEKHFSIDLVTKTFEVAHEEPPYYPFLRVFSSHGFITTISEINHLK